MTVGVALRLLVAMALWAGCFPIITIGLGLAPQLAFAAMRAALAGLCLLAVGFLLRRPVPGGARTWRLIVLVALGATTLGFLSMFQAAEFVSPGIATVITSTQPLLVAILAPALLGERLKATGKIGLIAGFAGVIAIALPGLASGAASGYALGIAYASLAAAGDAVGRVAMKRLPDEADAIMAMGFQLLLGAAPLVVLSVSTENLSSVTWSAEFLVLLVALSTLGTALPFWLWFTALKQVELNRANAFTFLVPLLGLAIGAVFFDERLGLVQVAGAALILMGVALVQREANAKSR